MKRLAIFTSRPSVHNTLRYFALKRAFTALGVQVAGGPMAPVEDALQVFCREFQPDTILELDRSRQYHGHYLPDSIVHIAWLVHQEVAEKSPPQGSQLLYALDPSFLPGKATDYGAKRLDWLPAASDPHHFYYEEHPWQWEVSYAGGMADAHQLPLLRKVAQSNLKVAFYGSDHPELSHRYQGRLDSPQALRQLYQTSCLNLHPGVMSHFRALDCLAAGGVIGQWLAEENQDLFKPDLHYVALSGEDPLDKMAYYLARPAQLRSMAKAAAAEVAAKHTWQQRAVKILQDWHAITSSTFSSLGDPA
ncbi:MAG: glycosyltransferase family 1 protein [Magnetococcales bacterium]|nr:glycosyltransferase family 1 protein [Magnetococcales bacterium]